MEKSKKCVVGISIYLLILLLLLFVATFVIFPVMFKYNVEFQRSIIFDNWNTEGINFSDYEDLGIQGVKNFYVTVNSKENITLGAWQILPSRLLHNASSDSDYNYDDILANTDYHILLYLHGNAEIRIISLELYSILRNYFQIIAVDYRGYADSTKAELTEDNIVKDVVNFYKWIREKSKARIFIWGHSLGTGVSTHVVSNLKNEKLVPTGLILETPFSCIPDVMEEHDFVKLISWLPWYQMTMLDPVVDNNFAFESTKYISSVDCPIMILHAKDDEVVPYKLATKLYETAISHRNYTTQGNVTYHLFGAMGYRHMNIFSAPELPEYVKEFVDESIEFENKRIRSQLK